VCSGVSVLSGEDAFAVPSEYLIHGAHHERDLLSNTMSPTAWNLPVRAACRMLTGSVQRHISMESPACMPM